MSNPDKRLFEDWCLDHPIPETKITYTYPDNTHRTFKLSELLSQIPQDYTPETDNYTPIGNEVLEGYEQED